MQQPGAEAKQRAVEHPCMPADLAACVCARRCPPLRAQLTRVVSLVPLPKLMCVFALFHPASVPFFLAVVQLVLQRGVSASRCTAVMDTMKIEVAELAALKGAITPEQSAAWLQKLATGLTCGPVRQVASGAAAASGSPPAPGSGQCADPLADCMADIGQVIEEEELAAAPRKRARKANAPEDDFLASEDDGDSADPHPKEARRRKGTAIVAELEAKITQYQTQWSADQEAHRTLQAEYISLQKSSDAALSRARGLLDAFHETNLARGAAPLAAIDGADRWLQQCEPLGAESLAECTRSTLGTGYLIRAHRPASLLSTAAATSAEETRVLVVYKQSHLLGEFESLMSLYAAEDVSRAMAAATDSEYLPKVYGAASAMLPVAGEAGLRGELTELRCETMEYIQGLSLSRWLAAGEPSLPAAGVTPLEHRAYERALFALMAKLARGVAHLHSIGIAHRDLTSTNVMVTHPDIKGRYRGRAKLRRPHLDSEGGSLHAIEDAATADEVTDATPASEARAPDKQVQMRVVIIDFNESMLLPPERLESQPEMKEEEEESDTSTKRAPTALQSAHAWRRGDPVYSRHAYARVDAGVAPQWRVVLPDTSSRAYWIECDKFGLAMVLGDLLRGAPLAHAGAETSIHRCYHEWAHQALTAEAARRSSEMMVDDAQPVLAPSMPSVSNFLHSSAPRAVFATAFAEGCQRADAMLQSYPELRAALHSMTAESWSDASTTVGGRKPIELLDLVAMLERYATVPKPPTPSLDAEIAAPESVSTIEGEGHTHPALPASAAVASAAVESTIAIAVRKEPRPAVAPPASPPAVDDAAFVLPPAVNDRRCPAGCTYVVHPFPRPSIDPPATSVGYHEGLARVYLANPTLVPGPSAQCEVRCTTRFIAYTKPLQFGLYAKVEIKSGQDICLYGGLRRCPDDVVDGSHTRMLSDGTGGVMDGLPFASMYTRLTIDPLLQHAKSAANKLSTMKKLIGAMPMSDFDPCPSFGAKAIAAFRREPMGFMANCAPAKKPNRANAKTEYKKMSELEGYILLQATKNIRIGEEILVLYNSTEATTFKQ
jgi:hypothetical protein